MNASRLKLKLFNIMSAMDQGLQVWCLYVMPTRKWSNVQGSITRAYMQSLIGENYYASDPS